MKNKSPVLTATLIVAAGVLICSALMQLIYLIVVLASPLTYHYSFILGNLLMSVTVVLNFLLMSLSIRHIIASGDTEGVRRRIQLSHMLRSLLILIILVIAFVFKQHFNIISTTITIAFPQISIFAWRILTRGKALPDDTTPPPDSADAIAGEPADVPATEESREEDNG